MSKKLVVKVNGNPYEVELGDLAKNPVSVSVNGTDYEVEFVENEVSTAEVKKTVAAAPVAAPVAAPASTAPVAGANTISAPMPGTILDISVKPGDNLTVGQPVCALEAMKMKNIIRSPRVGKVASVEVTSGQKVAFGTVIIRFA